MSSERDLREIGPGFTDSGGEPIQESVLGDTMAAVSAAASVGALGYARAQYRLSHDAQLDSYNAELEAIAAYRQALDNELRALYAQQHGLDALDRLDGFGFGVDEYYPGFADDDWFGVE
jgi:hypothetical protein